MIGEHHSRRLAIGQEMTVYTAPDIRVQLMHALAGDGDLELDLSQVAQIDAAGLQLLLLAKHEARRLGRPLRVVAHSDAVRECLEFSALVGYFGDPPHISAHA